MYIVFLGNCQARALADIVRRFVSPYTDVKTEFVDAYNKVGPKSHERLLAADVLVAQATIEPPPLGARSAKPGVPVHLVPLVNGSFLYPYQGLPHPLKPKASAGNPPYPGEYNDRFLSKLILDGVSPQDALAQYKHFDVAKAARVGRLYELAMEGQVRVDGETGYDCAGIIAAHLPSEQLFHSAFHYGGRIARHVAGTLCDRLGFEAKFGDRIRQHLTDTPFVPRLVPVHPSVARHFGMTWVTETTRYKYLWEGDFTFDEYVLRFMQGAWNSSLQEAIMEAEANAPGARAKLEAAMVQTPASARGAHELSQLVEADGDVALAVEWQRRAVANGGTPLFRVRLGNLLQRAGDIAGAEEAFAGAVAADPVSPVAWGLLRDVLIARGKLQEALVAAEKAVEFAVKPQASIAAQQRLKARGGIPA